MKATLYQMRADGKRLTDAEWQLAPIGPGVLSLHFMTSETACTKALTFSTEPNEGGRTYELVAKLFEPDLMNLGGTRLRIRGFQQTSNGRAVVQEWLCDLI